MTVVGKIGEYGAFARRLSRRHRRTASGRPIGMILRLRSATPAHVWHQPQQRFDVAVALRMPVTVRNDARTTNLFRYIGGNAMVTRVNSIARVLETQTAAEPHRATAAVAPPKRSGREIHTRRVETVALTGRSHVRTPTPRYERVDGRRRPAPLQLSIAARHPAEAPVSTSTRAPSAPAATTAGWEPALPIAPLATGTSVVAAPAADIERLTDRVVAAIDQRLIAHRERTGRGWV